MGCRSIGLSRFFAVMRSLSLLSPLGGVSGQLQWAADGVQICPACCALARELACFRSVGRADSARYSTSTAMIPSRESRLLTPSSEYEAAPALFRKR